MRKKFISRFVTIACMVSSLTLGANYSRADLLVGQPVPGAQNFATWDGTSKSLDGYKGKIVVLEWYNPECPFVKKHYSVGNMQSLQREYTEKGVVWLTVNSNAQGKQGSLTAEQAKAAMKAAEGAPTSVVLDSDGALGKAFGAKTTPHIFIVGKDGRLAYEGAIDDNDSARSETIKGAKNYVRSALDELLNGKAVSIAQTDSYGCSVKYAS